MVYETSSKRIVEKKGNYDYYLPTFLFFQGGLGLVLIASSSSCPRSYLLPQWPHFYCLLPPHHLRIFSLTLYFLQTIVRPLTPST